MQNMTLGELIDELSRLPRYAPVELDCGGSIGSPHSYRGYYEDLEFQRAEAGATVGSVLGSALKAMGQRFEGYKGGGYVMRESTLLWVGQYGEANGRAIVGLMVPPYEHQPEKVVLMTEIEAGD